MPIAVSNGSRLMLYHGLANWDWTPGEMKPAGASGAIAKYIFQFL